MTGSIIQTTLILSAIVSQWTCRAFSQYASNNVAPFARKNRLKLSRQTALNAFPSSSDSITSRLTLLGRDLLRRSDTLRIAGFYNNQGVHDGLMNSETFVDSRHPLLSGLKTGLIIFAIAVGMKFYRAFFVNKLSVWERQPAWGSVITSSEDEEKSNLEAMTCNNCGSTLFIAKGRKWFQFPTDYECYACGAKGVDNFTNTRKEIKETFDDDDFEYQNPLDLISSSEKRKLMKLAGGDEVKAALLLKQQGRGDEIKTTDSGDTPIKKKTQTDSIAGNKKGASVSKSEDGLDLLGMDD